MMKRSLSTQDVKEKFIKAKGKLNVIRTLGNMFGGASNDVESMVDELQQKLNDVCQADTRRSHLVLCAIVPAEKAHYVDLNPNCAE